MEVSLHVGGRIAEARVAAGLTQEALARDLACSLRSVAGWEAGHAHPRPAMLARLAAVTGKPVAWFYAVESDAA